MMKRRDSLTKQPTLRPNNSDTSSDTPSHIRTTNTDEHRGQFNNKKSPGDLDWIIRGLKNRRTLKTWVRCILVLIGTLILLVNTKTANSMGSAAFFASLVAIMLPPAMALSLFVFASFTLVLGMLLGWAWGSAAMAASLSVRSSALLARQQQQAQASLVQGYPIAAQQQSFVFHGMFLDPRSSVVYGAFLFIGTFALGTVRAYFPKLTLLAIFGTIVLDVLCSYGPLFPTSQYLLAKTFLIPTLYYVAIALASLVFIFPESMNHVWLTSLNEGVLTPIIGIVANQSTILSTTPSDHEAWQSLHGEGAALRAALIPAFQGLMAQVGFVDLEISVGRLGSSDLKRLAGELKLLTTRTTGMLFFQATVNERNRLDQKLRATSTPSTGVSRFEIVHQQMVRRETKHKHGLDDLVPILSSASSPLRNSCASTLKTLSAWVQDCNSGRWTSFFSSKSKTQVRVDARHSELLTSLEELKKVLGAFRNTEQHELLKPFEPFFDPSTGLLREDLRTNPKGEDMFTARNLYMCFTLADTLVGFAEALIKLMEIVVDMDDKRRKVRVWAPSGFGKLWRKLTSKEEGVGPINPLAMGSSTDPTAFKNESSDGDSVTVDGDGEDNNKYDDDEKYIKRPRPRNPDALEPKSTFGRFAIKLGSILAFFRSPEGIFALRMGIVSVALWIPAVCASTAWFNYKEKGLWALIMSQTGLAVFAGDQISGFILRMLGTILGLLVGMAVWYIGSGSGHGNPYGVVIATAVFTAPLIFARMTSPPQFLQLWILAGVTTVLIVGYSWLNIHTQMVASTGIGVHVAWRRALLVVIGFTAGFIVMLFPNPSSSRTLVRKTLASTIDEVGYIYAREIEVFLADERRWRHRIEQSEEKHTATDRENRTARIKSRVKKLSESLIELATRLQGLAPSLKTARFEPQIQGVWPAQQYEQLHVNQLQLVSSLALLGSALSRLDEKWISVLIHRTPFLNPNMLADTFSNISIISSSLRGGHHIPASLPLLRDRIVYHERHHAAYSGNIQPMFTPHEHDAATPRSQSDMRSHHSKTAGSNGASREDGAHKFDGGTLGIAELTLDIFKDEHFPIHSSAILALAAIYRLLDEAGLIVKKLCGESNFHGFDSHRDDYLGQEERTLGTR